MDLHIRAADRDAACSLGGPDAAADRAAVRSWLASRSSASPTTPRSSAAGSATSSPATRRHLAAEVALMSRGAPCEADERASDAPSTRSSTRSATTSSGWRPWSPSASRGAPRCCCPTTCRARSRSSRTTTSLDDALPRHRGALLPGARPAAADGHRPAGASSPPSGSRRRSSGRATSWSTWPRAPGASTASSSTRGCAASSSA